MNITGFFRGVRQLGLRAFALTLAAMLLLNIVIIVVGLQIDSGASDRDDNPDLLVLPVVGQAVSAARLLDSLPSDAHRDALGALNSPILMFRLIDDFSSAPTIDNPKEVFVPVIEAFTRQLEGRKFSIYIKDDGARYFKISDNLGALWDELIIVLQLENGQGLVVEMGEGYRLQIVRFVGAYLIGAIGLALVGLLIWASVSYAQPLARLAAASARFSRDLDAEPMQEAGPKPVRDLAIALNEMQDRLRALVAQRTTTLAAIAHDMRTYLTRLRMRSEFIDDRDQYESAVRDLEDMARLLEDALALGEAEAGPSRRELTDLNALLRDFVERRSNLAEGAPLGLELRVEARVKTDPSALTRALDNLVENALRYAGGATIALDRAEGEGVAIAVLDDGPGVPEEQLEMIVKPFARLEASRSRETGGAGLGLAIAAACAKRAAAPLRLRNRPSGGLAAELVFSEDHAPPQ